MKEVKIVNKSINDMIKEANEALKLQGTRLMTPEEIIEDDAEGGYYQSSKQD